MSLDEATSKLIGDVYAGATDPAAWDRAVDALVARTRTRFAFMATLDTTRHEFPALAFRGQDDGRFADGIAEYEAWQYRYDPLADYAIRHPNARAVRSSHVFPDCDYLQQPYVRWSAEMLGSAHWQVCYSPPDDGLTFGISLHRKAADGPLNDRESSFFGMIFDHMEQSRRIAARPVTIVGDTDPTLLIDLGGRVCEMSDAACALLETSDGLRLEARNLRTSARADQARLDAAIAAALGVFVEGGAGGVLALPRPSGKRPLGVRVTPLPNPPSPFEWFRPAALMRIVDPEAGPPFGAAAAWRALYRLTPAETRLATTLLSGEGNLRDAAEKLGIAYATARVQLASVFDKTETRRQRQLVKVLSLTGG